MNSLKLHLRPFETGARCNSFSRKVSFLLLIGSVIQGLAVETEFDSNPTELKRMSLEVTSTARRTEPLFTSPSAIQVITQEDIRRSGATSIPEALRLASNLQVAQVDSRQWAISARGFTST